jgi:hypothetical protein
MGNMAIRLRHAPASPQRAGAAQAAAAAHSPQFSPDCVALTRVAPVFVP